MYLRHLLPAISLIIVTSTARADSDWPSWRGPESNGHTRETGFPVRWDVKSVTWRVELPGNGQSSPILWGDRIFLTSALDKGKKRIVLCVDRKKGTILWQQEAWTGVPEPSHEMNGWASATCATDGQHVYAFFGKGGLHCYTVEGKHVWSRDLGAFAGVWGTSACPILAGDLVVQNCDALKEAFLIALDKKTGKTIWQTPRTVPEKGGWSTPVLVSAGKHQEIVLNGERAVTGYDPANGKQLWSCKSFAGRGEPTVAPGKDIVYVINGLAGDIYAVRTGGAGDVTKSHMAWHTPRKGGRDQPSPIVVGDYLLATDMTGITTCYSASTGKVFWRERLRGAFTAAPIAAQGLVYIQNEAGETFVIEPAASFKLVADNALNAEKGEIFRATLAPSAGQLFSRSQTHLYCIGDSTGR